MQTVKVEVSRLKDTLSKNLETHRAEYKEARAGFEDARRQAIAKLGEVAASCMDTKEGRQAVHDAYEELTELDKPTDHSKSYEQAIALMEWETRGVIDLSVTDFERYVRDNWSWTASFKNSASNYSSR